MLRAATLAALALGASALVQAGHAARVQGWTYDEPIHLAWSERLLATGEWERESRERFNSKTPIVLPNVLAARASGAADGTPRRFPARLPTVAWLAALLVLVFAVGRERFGPAAGALAAAACALDPNLVAHASLVTVDLPFAAATLFLLWSAVRAFERPSLGRAVLAGAAFGLALATKFSAVLFLPLLAVGVVLLPRRVAIPPRRLAVALGAAAAAAWVVVAAAYLFHGLGVRLGAVTWSSGPFRALAHLAPGLPSPVPAPLLTGLDLSLVDERGNWPGYLFGRRHPGGVWYYFIALWALKTPVLLAVASAIGLRHAARHLRHDGFARLAGLGLVAGLLYFSLVFRAHIGYRFVLMLLPLLYLLAAAGWASAAPRWGGRAAAAVATVSLIEGLAYAGNPLAFTSSAVQPKSTVFRWLADSNVDWGQDRERIAGHVRARGAGHTQLDPVHLMPGHNTIGTNALAGLWDPEQHRWVRENLEPGGHFLYTYPWFDVDEATFDRFLSEARRLRPTAWAGAACAGRALVRHGPGSRVPLVADRPPSAGEGWIACLEAPKGADVALRVPAGRVRYGTLAADGSCAATLLDQGDAAWYRLDPGTHALCLAEIANRRAWLPYRLETTWVIRGHAVSLEARPHVFSGPTPPPPESASPRSSSPPPPPAG